MRWSEEIEDNLHRVECSERNLNEECVPVAHGAVPETWKLESLELASLIALRTDESCILVYILKKIEALSLIVMQTAYDVNRIEVCRRCEGIACMVVRHIDLYALENLERCRSVLVSDDERTAARLTLVLHHTCNSYRTVQLRADSLYSLLACISLRKLDAEDIVKECLDIVAKRLNLRARIKVFIYRIIARNTCYSDS